MRILSNTGGIASTNCYLVIDEPSNEAVLFDAPDHTIAPLLREAHEQKLNLLGLWLTHGHFDHLADHEYVRTAFPQSKLLIHKLDEPKLTHPGSRMFPLPFVIPPGKADGFWEDGQTVKIGSLQGKVIHTPGHSPGHVCFYFEKEELLVGGDLIIGGSIGRTDLPDSNMDDMTRSLRRIMQLPATTRLLPGHGRPSTLAHERETNPYLIELLEAQ